MSPSPMGHYEEGKKSFFFFHLLLSLSAYLVFPSPYQPVSLSLELAYPCPLKAFR